MEFNEITIEDRHDIDYAWRRNGLLDCDLAFANIFCWGESYPVQICRIGGYFVLKARLDDSCGPVYTMPARFGDKVDSESCPIPDSTVLDSIFQRIEQDAASDCKPLQIMPLTPEGLDHLRLRYPNMGFCYRRSHSDYIYSREDLALLTGHKYQAKRNHIKKFMSEYVYEYTDLRPSDKDECLSLLSRWRALRVEENILHGHQMTPDFICELDKEEKSIRRAFDNFLALGLLGGAIRVGGHIVAFCYGSALSDDTFCTHIEKCDESYDGIFPTINQLFTQHLPECYKYINREDDLGLAGLRNAKLMYHPEHLLHKYTGVILTPTQQQVRNLWLECFPLDAPLDAEQFLLTQFSEDAMLAHYEGGRLVCMLHIIPFGDTAYLYAICTSAQWRHRGIAGALIRQALDRCRERGFSSVALIPENERSAAWYATMGFTFPTSSAPIPSFATPDYDFGRCDGTPDIPMVRILRESLA